ncbi:LysR family transcriptional regulator [Aquibium sp. A9E412]|uniref:LysR family transcriptional regulator n=1 Tax=Aquibium sp. A9E412 TaxID=2976767 RepID=UPI0025AFD178|nr:LysR family transcriptional regulator [Aquibium sp. A9E412]MDN2567836.1 LysR family transcriptional regulator [Aquibium sp. A9E412]
MKGYERHLRAAVALERTRNFRRAAEAVGISQPAFSVLISDLEKRLGAPLFHRTTRMVEPMDYARGYLSEVARTLDALDATSRSIEEISALKRGKVVVTCLSSLSARLMPAVLQRCWQEHPGIDLAVSDDVATRCLRALMEGEADFAVTGALPIPPALESEDLLEDPVHVLFPAGHRFAAFDAVPLAALAGETLVLLSTTSGIHRMIGDALAAAAVPLARRVAASHLVTIHGMTAAGLGVALLPRLALPHGGGGGTLDRPLAAPALARTVSVSWRRDRTVSPAGAAFLAILRSVGGAVDARQDAAAGSLPS